MSERVETPDGPAWRCAYCARWAGTVIELNGERLCGPCESLLRSLNEARSQAERARAGARELLDELCSLSADHEFEPREGERLGYAGFQARWEARYPWLKE